MLDLIAKVLDVLSRERVYYFFGVLASVFIIMGVSSWRREVKSRLQMQGMNMIQKTLSDARIAIQQQISVQNFLEILQKAEYEDELVGVKKDSVFARHILYNLTDVRESADRLRSDIVEYEHVLDARTLAIARMVRNYIYVYIYALENVVQIEKLTKLDGKVPKEYVDLYISSKKVLEMEGDLKTDLMLIDLALNIEAYITLMKKRLINSFLMGCFSYAWAQVIYAKLYFSKIVLDGDVNVSISDFLFEDFEFVYVSTKCQPR